jgi:hypothetical protein
MFTVYVQNVDTQEMQSWGTFPRLSEAAACLERECEIVIDHLDSHKVKWGTEVIAFERITDVWPGETEESTWERGHLIGKIVQN